MEFLPKGLVLTVDPNNCTYGIAEAIRGHNGNNEGGIDDSQSRFTLGPCIIEQVSREVVEKNLPNEGRWWFMLAEMHTPIAHRYMFLDGQQVIYVSDANTVSNKPFMFQITHASFRSQQGSNWRDAFPAEVWE